jgi:hypothetical protein
MPENEGHISDRDLLLAADEELSAHRLSEVSVHLASCAACRVRMRAFEETSADLAMAYRNESGDQLPDSSARRAALIKQIAQQSKNDWRFPWLGHLAEALAVRPWAYNAALALIAVLGIAVVYQQFWLTNSGGTIAQVQAAPLPRPNLTPGAAIGIPSDICVAVPREDPSRIPVSERKEVFREYGMDYRHAGQYELDHLITPALGGTDDIHNLWPEPYASTEWNAHVKDQLEDRLHQMVCSGQIDLSTAQRDISSNWIDAYKRYFHTDRPLPSYSAEAQDDDDFQPKS